MIIQSAKFRKYGFIFRSRYWLQGVLISMLGSAAGRRSKSPARLRSFHTLGHCNCAATTVVRNNFLSFRILPPLGRSSGGKPRFNFVETLHREGSGETVRERSPPRSSFSRFDTEQNPHSRAQVLGTRPRNLQRNTGRPQARTSQRTRTSSAAEQTNSSSMNQKSGPIH